MGGHAAMQEGAAGSAPTYNVREGGGFIGVTFCSSKALVRQTGANGCRLSRIAAERKTRARQTRRGGCQLDAAGFLAGPDND